MVRLWRSSRPSSPTSSPAPNTPSGTATPAPVRRGGRFCVWGRSQYDARRSRTRRDHHPRWSRRRTGAHRSAGAGAPFTRAAFARRLSERAPAALRAFPSHLAHAFIAELRNVKLRFAGRKLDNDPRGLLPLGYGSQIKLVDYFVESLNENCRGLRTEISPFQHALDWHVRASKIGLTARRFYCGRIHPQV